MIRVDKSSVEEPEFGRHFLGVYDPGGSCREFFLENDFANERSMSRIPTETFGIKLVKNFQKNDTLRLQEVRNSKLNLFFSGEIYNFDALCNELDIEDAVGTNLTCAELSALLYSKNGISFASKINGLFSVALMDFNENALMLYSDRFASAMPIFYHWSDKLIFGSQLKLLLRCRKISREIDQQSLAIFLKYSYIPGPRTIIRGVNKLGPGEVLIFRNNTMKKFRYIDFQANKIQAYNEDETIERYIDVLKNSIHQKMKTFDSQRIGFFLSGGLDSSANIALASLYGGKHFKTFGIGFDDPNLDERPYARLVAKHFGIEFLDYVFDGSEIEDLPKIVWYLDEPFMENGLFLTYAGFKSAQGHADLIVAGDGADQLFGTGGFAEGRPIALRYLLDRLNCRGLIDKGRMHLFKPLFYKDNFLFKLKVMVDRSVDFNDWFFWGFDEKELNKLCKFSIGRENISCFSNKMKDVPKTFSDYYHYALMHQDIEHYACQNIIVKSFRMAELFGIKIREAYLDNNVIDFVLQLKMKLKTKGNVLDFLNGKRTTKYLHRLAMEDILPREILQKPKQGGFIPMTLLLADLKRRKGIFRYLQRSEVLREFFNTEYIEKVVGKCEKCLTARTYWQVYQDNKVNQLMNLLVFALWYDMFINNDMLAAPNYMLSEFIKN